ncbi:MAG: hypothetical protein AB7G35_18330 [Hyphomicrobiaceae bacterium]
MPLQNRVTPDGTIIATPHRGTVMGNRGGCMHDASRRLTGRRWVTSRWICCTLSFKGRHREVMAPNRYTELFFLDEATALAAGHRPCFTCRYADATCFAGLWSKAHSLSQPPSVDVIDRALQRQRLDAHGHKRTFRSATADLPDGTMIRLEDTPLLIWSGRVLRWSLAGYEAAADLSGMEHCDVLTPPGIVAVLKVGYRPNVHASALIGA